MAIKYKHSNNLHSLSGAKSALPEILAGSTPESLLDVGCGTGTWMKAAIDLRIKEVIGINGIIPPLEELNVDEKLIIKADLSQPLDLKRKFDLLLCLEVAEHLDETDARRLIESLTRHSDTIAFSAAIPGQSGDHHANCQWPQYWQALFNEFSFSCSDDIRFKIWEEESIEPWYRQNLFMARRDKEAGSEARLLHIIHHELLNSLTKEAVKEALKEQQQQIELGSMRLSWYAATSIKATISKLLRRNRY